MASFGETVAGNVRAERARRKWTQADLGERLGVSAAAVSDLETGRRRVLADDLPMLCAAFDISLAQLAYQADPADRRALRL
jgi:transcriptional regulator with XRE-family HTH domain